MVNQIGSMDYNTFADSIDCLQAIYDWQSKLRDLGIDIFEVREISEMETQIIEILDTAMGLKHNDDIAYYCYERNFGKVANGICMGIARNKI